MRNVKKIATILAVLALSLPLASCGKSTTTVSNFKGTLNWWRSSEDASSDTLQATVAEYEQSNPNVKINIVLKDPATYDQSVIEALASAKQDPNSPDIVSVKAQDMPYFASALTPAPSNLFDAEVPNAKNRTGESTVQYVQRLFEAAAAKSVIFNDTKNTPQVYGLPMAMDDLALYENSSLISTVENEITQANHATNQYSTEQITALRKLLEAAPATWTDVTNIAPYFNVTSGKDISRSAIALGTSKNIEHSYDILQTLMMQNNTQMTSADMNSATFNLPVSSTSGFKNPGQDALQFYLRFSSPSDPLYSLNDSMPNDVDAFMNGQVAMMVNYASAYRYMINETPTIKGSITVNPLPQFSDPKNPANVASLKTMADMWVETVPAAKGDTARQDAAWDFTYFATSKTGATPYLQAMMLPSALKNVPGNAKFDAFATQKTIADRWFKGNQADKVDLVFIQMVEDIITSKSSLKDSLDAAAAQTTAFLQQSKIKWATSSTGSTNATN